MEKLNKEEMPNQSDTIPFSEHYRFNEDSETTSLLEVSNKRNAHIREIKDKNPELWQTILQKLKIDWTYHSNSIEGSTLSRGDTHFFLTEGLTVEGKPFKDFLDAKNHAEAIDFLFEVITNERDY